MTLPTGEAIFQADRKNWIAVCGFAPSRKHFPFEDERWWTWGCNDLYAYEKRVDVTFEIHHTMNMGARRNPEHEAVLRGGGKRGAGFKTGAPATPVFMQEAHPEYPTVIAFPKNRIFEAFGQTVMPPLEYTPGVAPGASYFTNSIGWMIALAILELTEVRKINGRELRVAKPEARLAVVGVSMAADCVAPETQVLTEDLRWVPASSVKVGDRLLAFDEEGSKTAKGRSARRYRVATVQQADEIMKPCYRLALADGTKMTVSDTHKWLCNSGDQAEWRTTENLRTGPQQFSRIVKLMDVWDEAHSRDAGYLAAAFDGEGHLSQQELSHCDSHCMRLSYAQRENAMSRKVEKALESYGYEFTRSVPKGSDCASYGLLGGRPELLRFLGEIRPQRLLERFDPDKLGILHGGKGVAVTEKEFVGEQPVIALKTDTGTFIAEGYASHNSEYIAQKPNVEYWIGRAQGYGIDVWVPDDAHILKAATLYGYASSDPLRVRLQSDREDLKNKTIEAQQAEAQLQQQLQNIQHQLTSIRAVKDYINGLERNLVIGTEIGIGSDAQGPGVGREVLQLQNGQTVESVIVASDNQPAHVGAN